MTPQDHDSHCLTWEWMHGERTVNNSKPCTCGLRTRQAEERATAATRNRPLKPLGMSEGDWLRTLGIRP